MVSIAAYCVSTFDFIQMDKSSSGPTTCNSPRPPTSGRSASSSGRCSLRGGTPSSTCPISTSRSRASTQVGKASTPETKVTPGYTLPETCGYYFGCSTSDQIVKRTALVLQQLYFTLISDFITTWVQSGGRLPSPWPAFRPSVPSHAQEVFEVSLGKGKNFKDGSSYKMPSIQDHEQMLERQAGGPTDVPGTGEGVQVPHPGQ